MDEGKKYKTLRIYCVKNGYMVREEYDSMTNHELTSVCDSIYVFEDLDSFFRWMKNNMEKPKFSFSDALLKAIKKGKKGNKNDN